MISGNVAYGQLATGTNHNNWGRPAERAVDGNRNPMVSLGTVDSCAYSRAAQWEQLFWQVDLGSPHVIYNLTVYGTDGSALNGTNTHTLPI